MELIKLELTNNNLTQQTNNKATVIKWCASQTDLVELIYALFHFNCFGTATIADTVRLFESIFNIELKNTSHTFGRVKERGEGNCIFMTKILHNLREIINISYR